MDLYYYINWYTILKFNGITECSIIRQKIIELETLMNNMNYFGNFLDSLTYAKDILFISNNNFERMKYDYFNGYFNQINENCLCYEEFMIKGLDKRNLIHYSDLKIILSIISINEINEEINMCKYDFKSLKIAINDLV